MTAPRVFADFLNADLEGRIRLNCLGTTQDLAKKQLSLHPGLLLTLYADDSDAEGNPDELEVNGVVEYSQAEQCWVACVDWSAVRNKSDTQPSDAGSSRPDPILHP